MMRRRGRASLLSLVSLCALTAAAACGSDDDASSPSDAGAGGEVAAAGAPAGGNTVGPNEGGTAGAPESWGPLELLSSDPEADSTDVWFYDPITLEFSNPLDAATVTSENVRVMVDGEALAGSLTLSPDSRIVSLRLSAPPTMAATATLELGAELRDQRGGEFAGDSWVYRLPLWQTPAVVDDEASAPALALDAQDRPVVARIRAGEVLVSRLEGSSWVPLGSALNPGGNAIGTPSLVFDPERGPVVAYREDTQVHVATYDAGSWLALGEPLSTSGDGLALALGSAGLQLALRGNGGIDVFGFDGDFVLAGTVAIAPTSLGGFALALEGEKPVVAYYDDTPRLALAELQGSDFVEATAPIALAELPAGAPALVVTSDATYVAYVDSDELSWNAFVRTRKPSGAVLEPFGAALDLSFDADASSPRLGASPSGEVTASWLETLGGVSKLYVARSNEGRPQFLGPALLARQSAPEALELSVDSRGNANVVTAEGEVTLRRYNGSPQAPFGLAGRASTKSCVFPATTSSDFPTNLAATGCYEDVAKHQVMDAALPYELNTALWSDGASKRRFIVLPDDTTITVAETGAWKLPIGTIVIKEFWYDAVAGDASTAFPMETRFLVKRCEETDGCAEPIEGYSYRWNAEGTEATLLTDAEAPPGLGLVAKWPVTSGGDVDDPTAHSHTYPSRAQCVRCHNASVGRYLGLQTPQLNRPAAFESAVDNQLRTFQAIGAFSQPLSAGGADAKARLPSSHDPAYSLEERALAYFHANCAHCHHPQGEQKTIDFRYYGGAGLTAANICNKLVPGDSANSLIYTRDATRPGGMPPIATLVPDPRALPVTAAWIDSLEACP